MLLLSTLYFLLSTSTYAGSPGTTGLNFLKIGIGGRAIGMGEAYTAVSDDASALYWNPAGLRQVEDKEVLLMHTKWLADIAYQYLVYAHPLKLKNLKIPAQTLGLGVFMLDYGEIPGYDNLGYKAKKVPANDMLVSISDSIAIRKFGKIDLMGGFNLKYIRQTLSDYSASALTGDLGFLMKYDRFRGGISAKNLFGSVNFIKEKFSVPTVVSLGVSYNTNLFTREDPLVVALDAELAQDSASKISAGVEYTLLNVVSFRVGYKTGQDMGSGLRAGLGLKMNIFQVDAAYTDYADLGYALRLGMSVKFGKPVKLRLTSQPADRSEAEELYRSGEKFYEEGRYLDAILELNKVLEQDPANRKALDLMKQCNEKLSSK